MQHLSLLKLFLLYLKFEQDYKIPEFVGFQTFHVVVVFGLSFEFLLCNTILKNTYMIPNTYNNIVLNAGIY